MEADLDVLVGQPYVGDLLATLDSIKNLPVLSKHHQRLRQLTESDSTTVPDLVRVVEQDQSFAANLLKVANSAIYAQRVHVDSIARAIQVVGFQGVADLALTLEVVNGFGFPPGLDMDMFWDHALNVALRSKDLAKKNGLDGDTAYTVGLLHDVGLLVLASFVPDAFTALMQEARRGDDVFVAGRGLFGCTHLDVSIRLMERWRFPSHLSEPLLQLNQPELAQGDGLDRVALAVHNAHEICHEYGGAFSWDRLPVLSSDTTLQASKDFQFVSGLSAAILSCCE